MKYKQQPKDTSTIQFQDMGLNHTQNSEGLSTENLNAIFAELNSLYEYSKMGFGFIDTNMNIIRINDTFSNMFNICKTKSIGKNILDTIPDSKASIIYPFIQEVIQDQHIIIDIEVDEKNQQIDSIDNSLSACIYPIVSIEEVFTGISIVVRDVTALRNTKLKLEKEHSELMNKNIAIREIMNQIEIERDETSNNIQLNFDNLIMPEIIKLEKLLDENARLHLSCLKRDLQKITSPYLKKLTSSYSKLSNIDIKVCNLIVEGYSTKQIAEVLNISEESIRSRRKIIRKKLGINHKKVKLSDFLQSMN